MKKEEIKEVIAELKLIGNYFDVSKLDNYEQKHHIRFTSIIKDRINFYTNLQQETPKEKERGITITNVNETPKENKSVDAEKLFYEYFPSLKNEYKVSTLLNVDEAISVLDYYLTEYANQSLSTEECKHNYEHYTNEHNETVAVCSKCMSAYF